MKFGIIIPIWKDQMMFGMMLIYRVIRWSFGRIPIDRLWIRLRWETGAYDWTEVYTAKKIMLSILWYFIDETISVNCYWHKPTLFITYKLYVTFTSCWVWCVNLVFFNSFSKLWVNTSWGVLSMIWVLSSKVHILTLKWKKWLKINIDWVLCDN